MLRPALLPDFAAEMGLPRNRHKLWFGIRSGYAIVAAFALLAALGHVTGLRPATGAIVALVAGKLVANTLAALALREDRFVLEASGLNVLADVVALTGAIYHTGGAESPLLPIYGIELTVIALLTNVGVTVSVGVLTFAAFAAMLALVRVGALPEPVSVVASIGGVNDTYLAVMLAFVAFVIGVPTAFVASILRELSAKEAALVARTEQLVEASRQKSQFMANVTHELRTPIHGICGLSDLVESGVYGPVTESQRAAARDIKGSALSLLRLIDDLLTLARDDAGKLEYRPSEFELSDVLGSVMATVGFLRGTRDLDVRLDAPEDLPRIRSDRGKLVQILVNLLTNAVKFTPDGGHVVLRARVIEGAEPEEGEEDARTIELSVEDDGIGIAPEDRERIFEAFRQIDGSAERRYGGTGLGLALVRRLTKLLSGEIELRSEVGRGSTFVVRLPVLGPADPRLTGAHFAAA